MLWLYRLLFFPVLLVLGPWYLLRMRRRGGYAQHFGQRFGAVPTLPPRQPGHRRIWLQAVSVGEMLAIGPLLEALARDPGVEIYLTTTTSTGYQLAADRYRGLVIGLGYFPLDAWLLMRRAWRQVAPDLVLLAEGERWPEHLRQARNRGVPVLCLNARVSDRSYRRMQAFRFLVQPLVGDITRLLAASARDAERFVALGFDPGKIAVTGSIKLDVAIPLLPLANRVQLRRELGLGTGLVLLGSSTWPGEETALVETLQGCRAAGLSISLLVVPRHAERRGEIEAGLKASGLAYHFRSRGPAAGNVDISVGDTTGELRDFTQLAELVFVGKSLAPHTEGQTPVEAAALGKPILFGPGMGNFRQIADELVAAGAARVVSDPAALRAAAIPLLRDEIRRATMAAAAQAWHRANQGAVDRTLEQIRASLDPVHPAMPGVGATGEGTK